MFSAGEVSTDTKQPVKSHKLDCACQASIPSEQSCQCCEYKDIGVSTSTDTETTTDHTMTREKLPPNKLQKDNQPSTTHTAGDGPSLPKLTDESDQAIAIPTSNETHGKNLFFEKMKIQINL